MKKIILSLIVTSVVATSACTNSGRTDSTQVTDTVVTSTTEAPAPMPAGDPNKAEMAEMDRMMKDMMAMTMTGDPDHDFAMMMKSHHQAALNMANIYLPSAKDEQIRSMVQKMIADQQKEISEFDTFLGSHKSTVSKSPFADEAMKIMHGMRDMGNMPEDVDAHFVAMMIPHHQGAVDMSKAYLKSARDEKTKSMAKKIIKEQEAEIIELKNWQAKSGKPVKS